MKKMAAAGNRSELGAGMHDNTEPMEDITGTHASPSDSSAASRRTSSGTPRPDSQRNVLRKSWEGVSSKLDRSGLPSSSEFKKSRNKTKPREHGRTSKGNTFTFEGYGDDDDDDVYDDEDLFVKRDDGDQPVSVRVDSKEDADAEEAMEEQRENERPSWSSRCAQLWSSILAFVCAFCTCNARKSEQQQPPSDMETRGSPSAKRRTLRNKLKPRLLASRTSLAEGAETSTTKRDSRPRGRTRQRCYEIIQKLSKWTSAREFFTLHAVRFVAITAGVGEYIV